MSLLTATLFMTVLNWSDDTTETATITNNALRVGVKKESNNEGF